VRYNPDGYHRRSIRLRDYDYSQQGAYFVTVCTWQRECLFGEIDNGEMNLTEYGEIVMKCRNAIPDHFPYVTTDEFVIMPNHIHGVVFIVRARHAVPLRRIGEQFAKPVSGSLSTIIRSFKSVVTKSINTISDTPGMPVWQRNYYEHVIRDEDDFARIRQYIADNATKWGEDENNPVNLTSGCSRFAVTSGENTKACKQPTFPKTTGLL
jgi:REP-associated tyrosine transposase